MPNPPEPGEPVLDSSVGPSLLANQPRYHQLRYLSRGSSGFVLEGLDRQTGQKVALKFLERGAQITNYVEREILNQLRLRHPHVVALDEVFLSAEHLVLVMELACGGDLRSHLQRVGPLSEDEARWFFQQLLFALDYCHRVGVCNRDIKLDNLLLTSMGSRPIIKVSDFGFSKDEIYQSAPDSRVGTPAYLAPEVITNVHGQSYDAKKADVWSCGVVLYAMLAGRLPFSRPEDELYPPSARMSKMLERIITVNYQLPPGRPLSESCKDLLSKMLRKDPSGRLSVQQVLQHPWPQQGLQPQILAFNDSLVAASLATPPPQDMLDEVASILREARLSSKHLEEEQRQQQQQLSAPAGPPDPASFSAPPLLDSTTNELILDLDLDLT